MTDGRPGGPDESGPELRARLRAARRAVDRGRRRAAERGLASRLESLPELSQPAPGHARLATYVAADGELDPNGALDALRARGWEPHLPVVADGRRMSFTPWPAGADLVRNRYGIPEPAGGPRRPAADLDVVLVPCVAVDRSGNRLGFGAGFYDRALEPVRTAVRPLRIAVAWDHAVVDEITPCSWDVPVHVVVTERRVLRPGEVPHPGA